MSRFEPLHIGGNIMSTNILVPLDGTALAEQALPTAVALVKQHAGRLELAIVHEPTPYDGLPDVPWNAMPESMKERYVTDTAEQLRDACAAPVGHALLHGDIAEEIVRRARNVGTDVIVMTTHGRTGLTRALVGSVADAVIREAGVPVLILRQRNHGPATRLPSTDFRRILILDDGSFQSAQIIDAAINVANPAATDFLMLQVVKPIRPVPDPSLPFGYLPSPADDGATSALVADARTTMDRLAAGVTAQTGRPVDVHVIVDEHPATAIVEFAKEHEIDLIAMTTHGRGASRLVFGSVTDAVLRSANLPMLVLRPVG
jgi:nucleotide-binding universal stress UspA family protein